MGGGGGGGGGGGHNCGTPTVVLSVILRIIIKLQLASTESTICCWLHHCDLQPIDTYHS